MNVIKYDPFRELRGLHDEMSRLFAGTAPNEGNEFARGAWSPRVDIFEEKDNLIVEVELPGLNREDFDVSVENNILTLKGERKFEKKENTDNFHRVERSYGAFTRQFTLPQTVTAEGATADFDNGVLRIALPKRAETKARKIEINSTGNSQPKTIEAETKSGAAKA
jgi:HSP20 family protein